MKLASYTRVINFIVTLLKNLLWQHQTPSQFNPDVRTLTSYIKVVTELQYVSSIKTCCSLHVYYSISCTKTDWRSIPSNKILTTNLVSDFLSAEIENASAMPFTYFLNRAQSQSRHINRGESLKQLLHNKPQRDTPALQISLFHRSYCLVDRM